MSNERERLAREWAESVNPKMPNEYVCAARDHILATTKEPTMADVEWDAEKHVLAGATLLTNNDEQVDVVMLANDVSLIDYATMGGEYGYEHCSYFTPNGKRYELREVTDQPKRLDVLETMEDYEYVPVGTIVAMRDCGAWTKGYDGNWTRGGEWITNGIMANTERQVLRWGWGE